MVEGITVEWVSIIIEWVEPIVVERVVAVVIVEESTWRPSSSLVEASVVELSVVESPIVEIGSPVGTIEIETELRVRRPLLHPKDGTVHGQGQCH